MAATGWVARRWFRRRAVAMIPFTLLVVLGTTCTLVAIGAAERTSGAYGEYLERAEVGDVVLNPSTYTAEIDRVIRNLPGVERVTSDGLFTTTLDDGAPRPAYEVEGGDAPIVFVHGSVDGRFSAMDRPAIRSGRLPTGTNEAIVSTEVADAQSLAVGDVVPVAFWWSCPGDALPELCPADETVEPIGVERVEVVGIGTFPDEVLPDGLYPRGRMIVSPDVADRYDCLPPEPPPGASLEEAAAVLIPPDCSRAYQYLSIDLASDAAGIPAALDAFVAATLETNARWNEAWAEDGPSYFLVPTANPQERARVERAIRPTVAALAVLGAATAALTIVLLLLAVVRELRRSRSEQRQWWRLGMAAPERAGLVAVPMLAAIGIGLVVSLGLAWLLSPIAPAGEVRSMDPSPRRELTAPVVLAGLGLAVVLAAAVVLIAWRSARVSGRAETSSSRPPRRMPRWIETGTSPAVLDGVRAAVRTRSAMMAATAAVGVAVVVAAVVFGASLSNLISTPRSYGWTWDVATMTGFGYGDLDIEAAAATLDGNEDVASYAMLGFVNEVSVNGEPVLSVIGLEHQSKIDLTVLDGRLPTAADEIALGANTAHRHGVAVGDEVTLGGALDRITSRTATVTGIVVFPALGPFNSDRVGTGTGMLLSEALFERGEPAELASFVGIDLVDGADRAARRELEAEMGSWDFFAAHIPYAEPVRPPEILDAGSKRAIPAFIVGLVASTIAAGMTFALWASVRSRRREVGILRALGFSGPEIRRSVRVQAIVTMLVALVVGVPAGVLAGRSAWQAFARELGVVPDPAGAWGWVLALVGGGLALAVMAAVLPARVATHSTPAAALRAQ